MAIEVISDFIRKDTVRLIQYVYDDDEALVDATSVDVTVVDPAGTVVVDEQAMNKTATGVYEYFYQTTDSVIQGSYRVETDITDSSYHTHGHGHFRVVKGINE